MKTMVFFLLLALSPASGAALELSLEENRGESGTIGYVDIDRVFKEYSGTLGAREDFLNDIRRKEEAISQRKTAIYTLKAGIARLREERALALELPGLLKTREQLAEEAEYLKSRVVDITSAAASVQAMQEAVQAQAAAAAVSTDAVQASTDTVQASTDTVQVPVSTGAVSGAAVQPPAAEIPAAVPGQPAAQPPAVQPLPAGLPGLGYDIPGISRVPAKHFNFSVSTSVAEIDAAIGAKEKELKEKEDALKLYQRQAEVELLQYESHKSELLLGRIYIALRELAIKEEVSVIVDKRSILFGHAAVDLTDKLLKKLEEGPL